MRNRRTGRDSSGRPLVIWTIIIVILATGLWYLWKRGGEQPVTHVEKVISPDRFTH